MYINKYAVLNKYCPAELLQSNYTGSKQIDVFLTKECFTPEQKHNIGLHHACKEEREHNCLTSPSRQTPEIRSNET